MEKRKRCNRVYRGLRVLAVLFTLQFSQLTAAAQGIPFIRNFTAEEYHANNTNFDIETDELGNVFVANFEGLMYYDYAEWRIIHTPGITRVTVVYRATDNTIWVGGYNYFGKIARKSNGEITLQRIGGKDLFRGEVNEIFEYDGQLQFIVSNGVIYKVEDDKISVVRNVDNRLMNTGMLDVLDVDAIRQGNGAVTLSDTLLVEEMGDGISAIVRKKNGIVIRDSKHKSGFTVTDGNGLCSNNISYAVYDDRGHLWGATSKGVFAIQVPTAITRFTAHEGIPGSVLSIESLKGDIYVGTDDGLFRQEGQRFVKVPGVDHACWDMKKNGDGLIAATADGLFRISANGTAHQLTRMITRTLLAEGNNIYCGEINGIFQYQDDGNDPKKVCSLENVIKMVQDDAGTIWAQGLYGGVWYKKKGDPDFQMYKSGEHSEAMLTVVMTEGKAVVVSERTKKPFPYPLMSFADEKGVTWLTNNEGKGLYRWKNGKRMSDIDQLLFPVHDLAIQAIYTRDDKVWLGTDNGLIIIDTKANDPILTANPKLFIRSVKLGSDSILWGGFGEMPEMLEELNHDENNLHFTFSLDNLSFAGETVYRYRLNNGSWSGWSNNTSAYFPNLSNGEYTFSVQARDAANHISEITSIGFRIIPPFYMRWYMNLLYLLLSLVLIYCLFRLRLKKLERDKIRLENIVQERTAEVVRLEKMATTGKLTQGLIDRILNPLNYINNFSKLSEGLIKDVKANIEDEKEHMDEENYEDTVDVLDMLKMNLQKVSEHGQNTTRILKAMEEILKDRSGGRAPIDLAVLIRQDGEMLREYYKKEIAEHNINFILDCPQEHLQMEGNTEQLSKTFMSLLANSVYAVIKKDSKSAFTPEISLNVTTSNNIATVRVRDNGIGIEDTIIDKIFDPFFTTKTTGEASGVGLYLSREIIQDHGGDISVKSVKDEFTEFTITLPYKK